MTGAAAARRGTSGPVRCMRFCSAPKSGRPWSSSATISPSTRAECPASAAGARVTSGYRTVMSVDLRENSSTRPSVTRASARTPSHLNS